MLDSEIARELYERLALPGTLDGKPWIGLAASERAKWLQVVVIVRELITPATLAKLSQDAELECQGVHLRLIQPEGQLLMDGRVLIPRMSRSSKMLMECLIKRFPRVQTREQILDYINKDNPAQDDRAVDCLVKKIRRELLGGPGAGLVCIETFHGAGYGLAIKQPTRQLKGALVHA